MKKLFCFLVIVMVVMLSSLIAYADGYCPDNEDETHHYDASVNMDNEHPHAGYLDCLCGSRCRLNKIYKYDCQRCREELCQKGYHYYLDELRYRNEDGDICLIGVCMCGDEQYLDVYVDGVSTVAPRCKLFYSNGELIVDPNYAHVVLVNGNEVQAFSDVDCEGECAACSYMSEYIEEIYEFSIWDYEHGNGEYYEGYVADRYNNYSDYDYYTDDDYDELQDWLDDVRQLFR